MAENKTRPTKASVARFVQAVPNATRRADTETLLAMYEELTGLAPAMWGPSIIGFGQKEYTYASGRTGTMPLAGFSPRKANMTLYVGDSFEGAKALYDRLGKHRRSVACLYVNKLDDVELGVLREIVAGDLAQASQDRDA